MKYTYNLLAPIVARCHSYYMVSKELKLSRSGNSAKYLKRAITRLNISTEHFTRPIILPGIKKHWSEVLIFGVRRHSYMLRRALIELGIEYVCQKCDQIPFWNNEPLTMQVDHIDGNDLNNTLSNLRFLCPNCHTQTPTHSKIKSIKKNRQCEKCGILIKKSKSGCCNACAPRNRKCNNPPTKEELQQLIWQIPLTEIAKHYGVSDKSVAKWCDKYMLQRPGIGYWMKQVKPII